MGISLESHRLRRRYTRTHRHAAREPCAKLGHRRLFREPLSLPDQIIRKAQTFRRRAQLQFAMQRVWYVS
jgi:hypothetical protein